jgi:tetratricopeptide (TPR) repeat protein
LPFVIRPSIAIFSRGSAYYELGDSERGERDYEKSTALSNQSIIAQESEYIRRNPADVGAYYSRAGAYEELGNYEKAIEDYSEVIRLDPQDDIAYIARGCVYAKLGNYEKAIEDYDKAVSLALNFSYAYKDGEKVMVDDSGSEFDLSRAKISDC